MKYQFEDGSTWKARDVIAAGSRDSLTRRSEAVVVDAPTRVRCRVCLESFTPSFGEYARCPECLGRQHAQAERVWTKAEMLDLAWTADYRAAIVAGVRDATVARLRAIAEILGIEP